MIQAVKERSPMQPEKKADKADDKTDGIPLLKGASMERYAVDDFTLSHPGCAQPCTSFIGHCMVESRGRIKIMPGDVLNVSARFRALGPKASQFYFGLKEFTNVGGFDQEMTSDLNNRQGNPCRVLSYDSKNSELDLDELPAGWTEVTGATACHAAEIGFYFDGEVSNPKVLPTIFKLAKPAYTVDGKRLKLQGPLPESITSRITRDTRVMNHLAGGSYNYAGAASEILDPAQGWITRQFTVRTASTSSPNWSSSNSQFFKPLVTSVSVLILANWGQLQRETELAVADIVAAKYSQ